MELGINLLPPVRQKAFRTRLTHSCVHDVAIILIAALAVTVGTFVAAERSLTAELRQAETEAAAPIPDRAETNARMTADNRLAKTLLARERAAIPVSSVLIAVAHLVPPGTALDELTYDGAVVAIRGTALDRADVLTMQAALKALPYAKDVDSPLSNILQKKNVRFAFTLTLDPARLVPAGQ